MVSSFLVYSLSLLILKCVQVYHTTHLQRKGCHSLPLKEGLAIPFHCQYTTICMFPFCYLYVIIGCFGAP